MKTCLVTGGAGFIGSNFVKYLSGVRPDIRIVNIDKLTYAGNVDNLAPVMNDANHIFIAEDICNKKGIREIFEKYRPDYAVNFAAESHVDRSIAGSEDFVRTNILGTQVLLQASLDYNLKKYIQISTDEVYGPAPDSMLFTEESPLMPGNPYSASKAAADLLVLSFHKTYNMPAVITRCTNNYGQNQHQEKLIPKTIKCCLEGREIPVYGDGANVRDWIYVYDHCSAIYAVLIKGRPGAVYNISSGNEKKNIQTVRLIIEKTKQLLGRSDLRRNSINENLIRFVDDRKGHDRRYGINSGRIRTELGWAPVWNFDEGIERTIKWYIGNGVWIDENTKQ